MKCYLFHAVHRGCSKKTGKTVTNSSPKPMLNNICTGNIRLLRLANKDREMEAKAELYEFRFKYTEF